MTETSLTSPGATVALRIATYKIAALSAIATAIAAALSKERA